MFNSQKKSGTLWFGRDAFGRRSLLVHWPTMGDARFVLSSVSPALTIGKISGIYNIYKINLWIYIMCMEANFLKQEDILIMY